MKKIILILILNLTLYSCDSDDSNDNNPTTPANEYAMTAKINGTIFEANNPFGTNEYSSTNIWSYFPKEDFFMLQGRKDGLLGFPEINIWIKRSDLAVGVYTIGQQTFNTPPSHFISLVDYSIDISTNTKEGIIEITEINTSQKIIKGTFQFTTIDNISDPSAPVDYTVTDGTFFYTYE